MASNRQRVWAKCGHGCTPPARLNERPARTRATLPPVAGLTPNAPRRPGPGSSRTPNGRAPGPPTSRSRCGLILGCRTGNTPDAPGRITRPCKPSARSPNRLGKFPSRKRGLVAMVACAPRRSRPAPNRNPALICKMQMTESGEVGNLPTLRSVKTRAPGTFRWGICPTCPRNRD